MQVADDISDDIGHDGPHPWVSPVCMKELMNKAIQERCWFDLGAERRPCQERGRSRQGRTKIDGP